MSLVVSRLMPTAEDNPDREHKSATEAPAPAAETPTRLQQAAARIVQLSLKENLGQDYRVKPILVFLGDWQVHRRAGDFDVAVMTVGELEDYFERQQSELTGEQITSICSHLERFAGSEKG